MKSNLQFGFNQQTKKFTITSPGEGNVSLSEPEIHEFVDFVTKNMSDDELKGENNDEQSTNH